MKCSKDDSGSCCGLCDYNPTVLIATDKRVNITSTNISLLEKQTFKPKITLITSDKDEHIHYTNTFANLNLAYHQNKPLGAKWQSGINGSEDPLIILGSDDILHPDYVKKCLGYLRVGFDLVGTTSWYSYDVRKRRLYLTEYINQNIDFPIGSGRVYSKKLLERMRYKVFDKAADKRLDDLGYKMSINNGARIKIIREPMILAVKGDWETMNPIEKYLKSPNISIKQVSIEILKDFGYV